MTRGPGSASPPTRCAPGDPALVCALLRTVPGEPGRRAGGRPGTPLHAGARCSDDGRAGAGRAPEWNDTAVPVPAGTLPELFEAQAARVPGCGGGGVRGCVGELRGAGRAGEPAGAGAGGAGAGPEPVVAVMMDRSAELVVALLAVLRRGRRTCRWIRATRRSGSRSCWPTRGPACVLTAAAAGGGAAGGCGVPVLALDEPGVAAAAGRAGRRRTWMAPGGGAAGRGTRRT